MRKFVGVVLMSVITVTSVFSNYTNVKAGDNFNRDACRSYAVQYAEEPCEYWPYFESDCTNFVSQCMKVGGIKTKDIPGDDVTYSDLDDTFKCKDYWSCKKYTKKNFWGKSKTAYVYTSTWTVVSKRSSSSWYGFYNYFKEYKKAEVKEYDCSKEQQMNNLCAKARVGDVVQVRENNSSTKMHSMVVTKREKLSDGTYDIYLSYHSNNKLNQSLRKQVYGAFKKDDVVMYTLIETSDL